MKIIYQDDYITVIYKPSGLLVHKTALDKWEKDSVLARLKNQFQKDFFPVHRLDRGTSGLLLLANSSEVAANLSKQFRDGLVKKKYLAVIRGFLEGDGIIDYPLPNIKYNDKNFITKNSKKRQEAITEYKNIKLLEFPFSVDKYPTSRYSIVELSPQTGRMHQLRRHMKHLSHPIVGDTCYGKSLHNNFFKTKFQLSHLLLTAIEISFLHPNTGKTTVLKSEVDDLFGEWLKYQIKDKN